MIPEYVCVNFHLSVCLFLDVLQICNEEVWQLPNH